MHLLLDVAVPSLASKTATTCRTTRRRSAPSGEKRVAFTKRSCVLGVALNLNGGPSWKLTLLSSPPVTRRNGRVDLKSHVLIFFVVAGDLADRVARIPHDHATEHRAAVAHDEDALRVAAPCNVKDLAPLKIGESSLRI